MTLNIPLVVVDSACRNIVVLSDYFDRVIEFQFDLNRFSFALGDAGRHFLQNELYHGVWFNLDQALDAKLGKNASELMLEGVLIKMVNFTQSFDFNCKLGRF